MKKVTMFLTFVAFALLLLPDAAAQEDHTQPKKFENVEWYGAYFVKFKPGMREAGLKIAEEHFAPIDKKLGTPGPTGYLFATGDWDLILYLPLEEGPSALAWQISPEDAVWNKALIEQEGGPEEAMDVFKKWGETIADEQFELAMRQME